jgi:hypothetical protein
MNCGKSSIIQGLPFFLPLLEADNQPTFPPSLSCATEEVCILNGCIDNLLWLKQLFFYSSSFVERELNLLLFFTPRSVSEKGGAALAETESTRTSQSTGTEPNVRLFVQYSAHWYCFAALPSLNRGTHLFALFISKKKKGDVCVGKTCILQRYAVTLLSFSFPQNHSQFATNRTTISLKFMSRIPTLNTLFVFSLFFFFLLWLNKLFQNYWN